MNPFKDQYTKNEVKKYLKGIDLPYEKDNLIVKLVQPQGRLDDLLNVNFRSASIDVPALFIDNALWMSLSYMECQSHVLPVGRATGNIGTGGLGLGYFVISAATQDTCDSVDVYETDKRVIDFFQTTFCNHPNFNKIHIFNEDVRTIKNKSYDYFYMDIYQTLCPNETLEDYELLDINNNICLYQFWGEEKVILESFMNDRDFCLRLDERWFFKSWIESGLQELYRNQLEGDFLERYQEIRNIVTRVE